MYQNDKLPAKKQATSAFAGNGFLLPAFSLPFLDGPPSDTYLFVTVLLSANRGATVGSLGTGARWRRRGVKRRDADMMTVLYGRCGWY